MQVLGARGYVGSMSSHQDGAVEVVLFHAGFEPSGVAAALRETMGLHISDMEALEDALPLVLFRRLDRRRAEVLCRRLRLAGAFVELRTPREQAPGLRLRYGRRALRAA
jgi:hypothetical protein